MNVEEIRLAVRAQLDLDEEDLPTPLLDLYIRDAFDHIVALETRWPSYEHRWVVTDVVGEQVAMPTDAREVERVVIPGSHELVYLDPPHADDLFGVSQPAASTPQFWSEWGGWIYLSPPPSAPTTLILRGYRAPADFVSLGAGGVVDADPRLHISLVWFCCSLAYAQQEDEVLEATYMQRFRETAGIAHDAIMRAWSGQPKILNGYAGHFPASPPQPQVIFNVPPVSP